ncbi:MAG: DUF1013 domain-containing protein [Alphaproteobacteria bacterium]|nr:DUF1013 domain-containing protein [Alphaproteobacteria bacterium]
MSDRKPLMPKATAVWLVDNTSLTFEQIAEFCGLHNLEVKGIADGDVAQGIKGMDPITSGQLTRDEIAKGEEDQSHSLEIADNTIEVPQTTRKRAPRYTPVSRRQDRPNAVLWLLRNHDELKDSQIIRLVGTTKPTIQQIRDRTHWNSAALQPQDPVTLGLCTQIDLDAEVQKAARRVEREQKQAERAARKSGTLLPTEETTPPDVDPVKVEKPEAEYPSAEILSPKEPTQTREETEAEEQERVFQKLQEMSAESSDGADGDADTSDKTT